MSNAPCMRMSLRFLDGLRAHWRLAQALTLLSEPTDNALDAQAHSIQIIVDGHHVVIRDNGEGIADIGKAINMGDSIRREDERVTSGRYGAGGKTAALGTGNVWGIETCRDGRLTRVSINFQRIIDTDSGKPDAFETLAMPGLPNYTEISITELLDAGKFKTAARIAKLQDALARLYHPAIRNGVQISLNDVDLPLIPHPKLDHRKTFECEFLGRLLVVDVGVMKHGDDDSPGLLYETGNRLLNLTPDISAFGLYANARVRGWVRLIEDKGRKIDWGLALDKSDFALRNQLSEFLTAKIEDVLRLGAEAAQKSTLTQRDVFNQQLLSGAFPGTLREARDQQTVLAENGQKREPETTGRKRTRAAKVSQAPGSVKGSAACPVRFQILDKKELSGGAVFLAQTTRTSVIVNVAGKHPQIENLKPRDIAFTWGICMAVAETFASTTGFDQGNLMNLLGIAHGTFGQVFAQLLGRLPRKIKEAQLQ